MRRMERRAFLGTVAGGLLIAPRTAEPQPTRIPRIGALLTADIERTQAQLRQELGRLGYVEGQNVRFEFRLASSGRTERLSELARELIRLKVDMILAQFTVAAITAKAATSGIPIIMAPAGDPIETGLITSLRRPGGNVTGVAGVAAELGGKVVQLVREMMPTARVVTVFLDARSPFAAPFLEQIQRGARTAAIEIESRRLDGGEELEGAFSQLRRERTQAVIIHPSLPSRRAAELGLKYRLAVVSMPKWFAEEGGLMAYGWDAASIVHQVATYVDRILKGAKPADLPVEQPTKFELTINLKTARALGLTIPPALLTRADQVIE